MAVITATPGEGKLSTVLTVTGLTTGAAVITRTDANGRAPVRMREGQVPIDGTLIVEDFEAALVGLVNYSIQGATLSLSKRPTSLNVLTVPVQPEYSRAVSLVTSYSDVQQNQTTLHTVIDRADPIATLRALRLRTGSLTLFAEDYETAEALREVYSRGEIVMLRQGQHAGLDLYHVADSVSVNIESVMTTPRRWTVTVSYTEVARPLAPRRGSAGWTYATVAAAYATYDVLLDAFSTYDDLTLGVA